MRWVGNPGRMRWVGNPGRIRKKEDAYCFSRKTRRKGPLGRPVRGLEVGIKTYLKEIRYVRGTLD
jgi:hypothetical protein